MQSLPDAFGPMAAYHQWIIYKLVPSTRRPGKMDKLPCDFRDGRVVSAHDQSIWTHHAQAIASAAHFGAGYGVGFTFSANDPFWVLDIDGAHDGTDWSQLSKDLCAAFAGCAIEVSSSGKGLHVIGSADGVPPHRTKPPAHLAHLGLEFYHTGRFIALTGAGAQGSAATRADAQVAQLVAQFFPPDVGGQGSGTWAEQWAALLAAGRDEEWRGPDDDEELLRRALRSNSVGAAFDNKASFHDLWTANIEALARAFPPDQTGSSAYDTNRADSALAQHLSFWTGRDGERIERLMRRSALMRDKWDREDYLPRTIVAVCRRQGDVLTDKEPEPLNIPHVAPASGERRTASRPDLTTGSTYLSIEQQRDLFNGCVYVCDADKILIPGGRMLGERQFRTMFGGYTFPMDAANVRTSRNAWEAFTQNEAYRCTKADGSTFKPTHAPGELIEDGGRVLVNTWWPVDVERRVGDPTPFLTHLAKLLPNERDRLILLSYMAACVQHVGVKFQWAPLLQGVEGNGKSLLSRAVAYAVGRRYVHWPKATKLANQFNGWMVGKVFYAVEDIYTPDARQDVIEELKPMITGGDGLEIEGKGADQVTADICGNFMFNSNHKDAIRKTRNDRRFAVFYTAQQALADLQRDGMLGGYMPRIYGWLKDEGGYAIVAELLATFPIPPEFNPAGTCDRAPLTSSTDEAIMSSIGGVEQEILEAIAQNEQGFAGGWISSVYLDALLERIGKSRAVSRNRRRGLLAELGYVPHPALHDGRVNNPVAPENKKPYLYVHSLSPLMGLTSPAEVAAAYTNAQMQIVFDRV